MSLGSSKNFKSIKYSWDQKTLKTWSSILAFQVALVFLLPPLLLKKIQSRDFSRLSNVMTANMREVTFIKEKFKGSLKCLLLQKHKVILRVRNTHNPLFELNLRWLKDLTGLACSS